MSAGPVNRALLETFFQSPGEVYSDAKTEGAFDVVADQVDDNWNYLSGLIAGTVPNPQFKSRQGIINGNFDRWQRGTTFSPAVFGAYTADRWLLGFDGTPTIDITRQDFTPGQTDVPNEPNFYARATITALNAATRVDFQQRIEDVRSFAGQTATRSFWVRANRTGVQVRNDLYTQNFGSGGSSPVTETSAQITTLTANVWTRITQSNNMPSITGKTIGAGSRLEFVIRFIQLQTADVIELAQVQINVGSAALPFQPKKISDEVLDCQRYFYNLQSTGNPFVLGAGIATSATNVDISIPAVTTMRIRPTLIANPANYRLSDGVTTFTPSAITNSSNSNENMFTLNVTAAGLTQFRPYKLQTNLANESLAFDAEM